MVDFSTFGHIFQKISLLKSGHPACTYVIIATHITYSW